MRLLLVAIFAALLPASANAAPALPVSLLTINTANGPAKFIVEVAADPATQERGLMYRRGMAPNAGMLFDFHQPAYVSFWMKNTILPLDMIFIRPDGTISTIAANAKPYSLDLIRSAEAVRAVLEINAGRAAALGIEPGERVRHAIFGGR
ncbi:MAG TPA: DUF192 domain-containing protein [Rhizomicrobium sp.]|nr:DUF192 domain-containing protein [Rhizomicrobium sp.]